MSRRPRREGYSKIGAHGSHLHTLLPSAHLTLMAASHAVYLQQVSVADVCNNSIKTDFLQCYSTIELQLCTLGVLGEVGWPGYCKYFLSKHSDLCALVHNDLKRIQALHSVGMCIKWKLNP